MLKINPFKPNDPVDISMFAGREDELSDLKKGLQQTKNGYPTNFLIIGERGIGKSSLLSQLKALASSTGNIYINEGFNYVVVNCTLSKKTTLLTLIQLIERGLKRELKKIESVRNFIDKTWEFIQRIKVLDSGLDAGKTVEDSDLVIDDFSYSLSETCNRLVNPQKGEDAKDGILFIIDEADSATSDLDIGYFFKVVTELLQKHECLKVMFVVAGLPDIIEKLSNSHESSLRIFTRLDIKELNPKDRLDVITKGMKIANAINSDIVSIKSDAQKRIATLSEGYPQFIQQFSSSAFDFNTDGAISLDDVMESAFRKGGALDAIGTKYYESAYHEKIKSDEYREVLTIMAGNSNSWIKKNEIRDNFTGADQTLTDALKALTTRKIILKNPSKMGEYRLQQRGFALWIKLFGQRPR